MGLNNLLDLDVLLAEFLHPAPFHRPIKPPFPELFAKQQKCYAVLVTFLQLWGNMVIRPNYYEAPHLLKLQVYPRAAMLVQTCPHPIIPSAADYGSWFSLKKCYTSFIWVFSRSVHVITTNKQSIMRPPLQGVGRLIWSAYGAHSSVIAAFIPAQMNLTKKKN